MDQDCQSIDFLYDFVYLDRPRAESWLAQLVAEGVPISAKYSATTTQSKLLEGVGGVPAVAGVKGAHSSAATEAHERQYNAEWSIPLNLADMLSQAGFLNKGLSNTRQGSLIHIAGRVQLIDIGFLQQSWGPLTNHMLGSIKPTHANKSQLSDQRKYLEMVGGVLQVMPKHPQLYMLTANDEVAWAVLKPEHSIVDISTITLTFGSNIQGDWHMIAVLDALPDDHKETTPPPFPMGGELAQSFPQILGPLREAVGRSNDAYAVSPIAIFRAIHKML